MVKLHPKSIRWRHLVAPLFVSSILILGLLGIIWPVAWLLLGLEVVAYLAFGLLLGRQSGPAAVPLTLLMPLVFLTIHLSWGSSFLIGLVSPLPRMAATSRVA